MDDHADAPGAREMPAVPPVTDPAVLEEVRARRDEVPWRGADAFGAALVYLLGGALLGVALATVGLLDPGSAPPPLLDSLLLLGACAGWLAVVRAPSAVRRLAGPREPGRPVLRGVLLGVLVGVVWPFADTALYELLTLAGVEFPPIQEHIREWLDEPATRAWVAVDIVLVTPLAEEALFRGLLFQGLVRRWGVRAAAVGSALLFGLAHVESLGADSVFMVASTMLFGVAAAWLLWRYGTLLAPVAAHVATNAIATAGLLAS
ncbi:MAG TPA: CPBP family intramembrane glutamic endopeptidase [Egibacteraceae bacterium]|nr:CPBP family intramembrane glutamic endopeptidase [Egibacteraceae bacterium]